MANSNQPVDIITIHDAPTCGIAWRQGAEQSRGDYIYFGADDVLPHKDWDAPLIEACDKGYCPTAVILEADGSVQSAGIQGFGCFVPKVIEDWMPVEHITTPFMSRLTYNRIPPMIPLHYCTDLWHSHCCRQLGQEIVVRSESKLTHFNHDVGRGAGYSQHERALMDKMMYIEYVKGNVKP